MKSPAGYRNDAKGRAWGMSEMESSSSGRQVIPEELAAEVRKLAHDLSNALEIIVQTSYLLGTAELKPPASDWLRLLEGGVQRALDVNGALRSYVREHSAK